MAASGTDRSNTLGVRDATGVMAISAEVTVRSAASQGGPGVVARLDLGLYNDGTSSVGAQGNVVGIIELRFGGQVLEIQYSVFPISDAEGNARNAFGPIFERRRRANFNEPHVLGLSWDGRMVTFAYDGVTEQADPTAIVPLGRPTPTSPFARLQARVSGPIADPAAFGSISATFDNVQINGAPFDDFTGTTSIDQTKWRDAELGTRVANGAVVLSATLQGRDDNPNSLVFNDQDSVSAIAARVRVDSLATNGPRARGRLAGFLYNDGSPGEGRTGNVLAGVQLRGASESAPLNIEWFVGKCNDTQCNSFTEFQSRSMGTAAIGQSVTLGIAWDGTVFTFRADQITATYDPRSQARPRTTKLLSPRKGLEISIAASASPTARASITATFDDVQATLTPPPPTTRPVLVEPVDPTTISLSGPRRLVLRWQPVDGAAVYGIEYTGAGRTFANPNAAEPDRANGFGGVGGAIIPQNAGDLVLPWTSTYLVLPATVPPGTYQ